MAVVRKKQDDKNLKILREIVTTGAGNRQCFDCGQKGPTYVNMTIGSFVCTRCSGVLRGLTPPHRVKSISMATFTPEEIEFLKSHGNDLCGKTWLGLWDPKRIIHQDQRELMIDKYERKRYYLEPASPLKSLTTATVPTVTTKLSSSISSLSSSSSSSNNLNNLSNYNNISNNNCSSQQIISNGGNINNSGSNSINSLNSNKFNDNSFKNITLTPPTSSRLHNGNSNRQQQTNGFKDDNIFMNGHTNNNHHQPRPIVTNKASLNISSSLDSSSSNNSLNGFTPDSDFIADFNTANIFNATTTSNQQNGFQNGGGGSVNGPIRNGNNFINNSGNNFVNGIGNNSTSNVNENFADFDHAPIYNAAVHENNVIKDFNSFASNFNNEIQNNNNTTTTTNNNGNNNRTNSINIFSSTVQQQQQPTFYSQTNPNLTNINLNRSDNNCITTSTPQIFDNTNLNNSKILTTTLNNNTNSNNSYYNQQWNNWQQFQWPPSQQQQQPPPSLLPTSTEQNINSNQQQQNHWSFPISGRNNSLTTSNTTLNSTPSIDRYAALKDLDEQLRETKVSTTAEPFMNGTTPVSNPNPFKTSSPSMPIQQNQQQQQIANPFQSSTTNGNGLFGSPQQQQSMLQQHHQLQQQNLLQQQQQQQLQMQQQIQMHQQQQQQHQQQQQLFNNNGVGGANVGFGTNTNFGLFNFNNGNDFNGGVANGNGYNNNTNNNNIVQQQQQQQPTMISTGANGCGMMGFGGGHQITAGSNMSNMKNPFTASNVLNSNNPFL